MLLLPLEKLFGQARGEVQSTGALAAVGMSRCLSSSSDTRPHVTGRVLQCASLGIFPLIPISYHNSSDWLWKVLFHNIAGFPEAFLTME